MSNNLDESEDNLGKIRGIDYYKLSLLDKEFEPPDEDTHFVVKILLSLTINFPLAYGGRSASKWCSKSRFLYIL